ncbi:hypothetical protein J6590_016003 [Homalodisca vitripennis]|nr:hypothetical protein J6590_016003 [Homalodisca vitripennis]
MEQNNVAIDVSREIAFWCEWPGQGIEQAGECRAVVGILEEGGITEAEWYLPHPA